MFSKKDLFKITMPLIIQQLLSVTVGMADSMMVSSAGEAAVSGVSLVNTLDVLLIIIFSSLVSGGAVVVSQFLGRQDMKLVLSSAKQLIYVTTGVATLVAAIVLIVRVPLLSLLFGSVEADVMSSAQTYLFYLALSFPFLAIYDACSALFRTMGNSVISMSVSLVMNMINVCGNVVLIYRFDMGAAGAAIATLVSRAVCSVIMVILLHNKKNMIYIDKLFHYRPDFGIIKRILHIGIPSGLESGMFQFGKLLTQSLISSMGTAAIAANAVANTLATFQYMPGTAIGQAAVTVVGRCIGAGKKEQAKKYSLILLVSTYACLGLIVILTVIFAKPIIGLYELSSESAGVAHSLIIFHALCAVVIWPIAFTLPHIFRASSDVKFPLLVSVFSMWAFRVALSYVFAPDTFGIGMGVMGVWVAMIVDWVFRAVLYGIRYFSGKWLTVYKFK